MPARYHRRIRCVNAATSLLLQRFLHSTCHLPYTTQYRGFSGSLGRGSQVVTYEPECRALLADTVSGGAHSGAELSMSASTAVCMDNCQPHHQSRDNRRAALAAERMITATRGPGWPCSISGDVQANRESARLSDGNSSERDAARRSSPRRPHTDRPHHSE